MEAFEISGQLRELIAALPDKPGVYIMKDAGGQIIYVGKAVSLKNRVRQYFQSLKAHSPKTWALVQKIHSFETIVTDNEVEALILECNLIKKHRPHYNILLKDDKNFPYVRIDMREDFPRVEVVRRRENDGAQYFGPYVSGGALREVLDVAGRMFPLRTCKKDIARAIERNERPCLNFQIGTCLGPCTGRVASEEYHQALECIIGLLSGRQSEFEQSVRTQMADAAEALDFERAARLRDTLKALDELNQKQKMVTGRDDNRDVFALCTHESTALVHALFIRGGKMMGSEHYELQWEGDEGEKELMAQFLRQYYSGAPVIPKEVLVSVLPENLAPTAAYLTELRGARVRMLVPQRGKKRELVELAASNAEQSILRLYTKARTEFERHEGALIQLADVLELAAPPERIEAFDISNTQGTDSVASMVVFIKGRPSPRDYRRFRIKTVEGANDFASMHEAVKRRMLRARNGSGGFDSLPDLLLIDGGKGQLGAAMQAMEETGYGHLQVIGLAKRMEEIFLPNKDDPVVLKRSSAALHLLQRVRDEAHRFAVTYHRRLRTGRTIVSELDGIPGIGKKRRTELIRHFKSVKEIAKAQMETLLEVEGMDTRSARAVYEHFHAPKTDEV
ncbi:MAG: excinuclease ABC subunit UvrC [Bacillota bacterium]